MTTFPSRLGRPGARVALAVCLAAVAAVGSYTIASAKLVASHYTHESCAADSRIVDPINVVWFGPAAQPGRVSQGLDAWGRWTSHDEGVVAHNEYVFTNGLCEQDARQNADDFFAADNRNHVRLFSSIDTVRPTVTYVLGDGHHDALVLCPSGLPFPLPQFLPGHIASSFNQGRDAIYKFWRLHRRAVYRQFGNTARIQQCTGSYTQSDGRQLHLAT